MSVQMSLEGVKLLDEVQSRGYAEFEHGIPEESINNLVECYADFTLAHPDPVTYTMNAMIPMQPVESDYDKESFFDDGFFCYEKWLATQLDNLRREEDLQAEWHKYRTNAPGIGKPNGYTNRSFQAEVISKTRGIDLIEDPKEFYHFTPGHYVAMSRQHKEFGWGSILPEVGALNTAFGVVHKKASELMLKICGIIEEIHPDINKLITPESLNTSPVRLLFYHLSDSELLAESHYDKSMATLQLAESHEGLMLATRDGQALTSVVRQADKAVFFTGHSFSGKPDEKRGIRGGHYPDSPFRPGWHRVLKTDRLNPGRIIPVKATGVCGRYAIIFFAGSKYFINPDKTAMHGR